MMTRLMTWFIELQNRFNESKLFKILMIYVLNQIDDLTSWQCWEIKYRCNIKSFEINKVSTNTCNDQFSK